MTAVGKKPRSEVVIPALRCERVKALLSTAKVDAIGHQAAICGATDLRRRVSELCNWGRN